MNNKAHDDDTKRQSKEIKKAFNKVAKQISDVDIAEDIFGRFEDCNISITYFEKGKITTVTIDEFFSKKTATFFTRNLFKGQEIYEALESLKTREIEKAPIQEGKLKEEEKQVEGEFLQNSIFVLTLYLISMLLSKQMYVEQLFTMVADINNKALMAFSILALLAALSLILLVMLNISNKLYISASAIMLQLQNKNKTSTVKDDERETSWQAWRNSLEIVFSSWLGIITFQLIFACFLILFWTGLFHLLLN